MSSCGPAAGAGRTPARGGSSRRRRRPTPCHRPSGSRRAARPRACRTPRSRPGWAGRGAPTRSCSHRPPTPRRRRPAKARRPRPGPPAPYPDPYYRPDDERPAPELVARIEDFLQARGFGFWYGSGAAAANCVACRPTPSYLLRFERLVATGQLDAATAARWRAWFAFLAHLYAGDDHYPGRASMLGPDNPDSLEPTVGGMCNQNFYTDVITLCGATAETFPAHPDAARWRARFDEGWSRQLDYHRYPASGLWEESHTYFQHVLVTVLPLLLLRRARGGGDGFADPRFRSLLGGAPRQATPRDAAHGGRRHLLAFGDHGADPGRYACVYGTAAGGVAPHDPDLAARLAWLHGEMGGAPPCAVAPAAPPWRDEAVQGLGFMFRGEDAQGGEVLLALRAGSAWGHHHEDDGSLQFFAFGRCLAGDAAYGELQDGGTKHSAEGHSRWTLRDYAVTNYRWRFNRGWISGHGSEPWAHATAWSPAFMHLLPDAQPLPLPEPVPHARIVVRLAPLRYLVLDASCGAPAQVVRFHLPDGALRSAGGATGVELPDCRVSVVPLFEADAPAARRIAPSRGSAAATLALAWEVGRARCVGFLLDAGPPGSAAPRVVATPGRARIGEGDGAVTVSWSPDAVELVGGADGRRLALDVPGAMPA